MHPLVSLRNAENLQTRLPSWQKGVSLNLIRKLCGGCKRLVNGCICFSVKSGKDHECCDVNNDFPHLTMSRAFYALADLSFYRNQFIKPDKGQPLTHISSRPCVKPDQDPDNIWRVYSGYVTDGVNIQITLVM